MKFIVVSLFVSALSISAAHAGVEREIIENPTVQNTFSLMQSKHGGQCEPLTERSVHRSYTGLNPDVTKLTLLQSAFSFTVTISCPSENASIYGQNISVYATDSSGFRADVKPLDLGIIFREINLNH